MSLGTSRRRDHFSALWDVVVPDLWQAVRRFPLPVLFCLAFAIHGLVGDGTLYQLPASLALHLEWQLAAAFLWTLVVAVWAQAGGKTRWEWFLANGFGLIAIMLLAAGSAIVHTSPVLLLPALALILSVAAHYQPDADNNAFWLFNLRLWFGAAIAAMGAALVVAGLLIAAALVEYLFSIHLPGVFYGKVIAVTAGLLAPLHWLTMIPSRFDGLSNTDRETVNTLSRTGRILRYVLIPVMLIFALVLYRFAFKVLTDGTLPDGGRIGPAVLVFAVLGIAGFMMGYPLRRRGGLMVRLYWRLWPIVSLVPLMLLAAATYARISAYGFTEGRYLLALVALWLLILSFCFIVLRVKDLRIVPASLAALLIVGSFGPGGATGLSLRSQTNHLVGLLKSNNILENDHVIAGRSLKLKSGDEPRIRSILEFLDARDELARLRPWYVGHANDPFLAAAQSGRTQGTFLAYALAVTLGVPKSPIGDQPSQTVVFYARAPSLLAMKGAVRLAGPVHLSLEPRRRRVTAQIGIGTGRDLSVMLDETSVVVENKRGRQAIFDLVALARNIKWFENKSAVIPALTGPLRIKPVSGRLKARLLVTSLQGRRAHSGSYAFKQISCWVLLY